MVLMSLLSWDVRADNPHVPPLGMARYLYSSYASIGDGFL